MFFAGRTLAPHCVRCSAGVETTDSHEIIDLPDTFGLDMTEKRRLLDHRIAPVTNCQVASRIIIIGCVSNVSLAR